VTADPGDRSSSPFQEMVFLPLDDFYLTPPATVRRWAEAVAAAVPGLEVVIVEPDESADTALGAIRTADAVFGALTPELLAVATRLRWLQAPAAAPPADFWIDGLERHPLMLTNLRGVYADNLADHVMAYVLAFARRLPAFRDAQSAGDWRRDLGPSIVGLDGSVMLLVGVGAVGTAVWRRARAFGIEVLGVDARPEQVEAELLELVPPGELDRLLPLADWVVLSLPSTPETRRLMSAERLARMKPGARLVNVGRGETVDSDALALALARGRLGGAALDVVDSEPLPASHPLWQHPDVILTPHVAGYGANTDARREALIVENARRFAAGAPLRNVVDKRLRY
jgi:phosphoglycerate dehydrogenase-like enzyme